jgi:transcriptional regulator with XRE-family HTH domain
VEIDMILGRVLAEERKRAGLTQEQLAYRAHLHPVYISQVERGVKMPTVRSFVALARAMKVLPSDLLRRIEEEEDKNGG